MFHCQNHFIITIIQKCILFAFLGQLLSCSQSAQESSLSPLQVARDGHHLEKKDGTPFFWMGDTAWGLFSNLDSLEVITYFDHRKKQKFNVIQCSVIHGGADRTNVYGETPFVDRDVTKPNEAFWQNVDHVVQQSLKKELYLAILPAWARTYIEPGKGNAEDKIFSANPSGSYTYGKFLGNRYKEYSNIVWVLGGDTQGTRDTIYDQMAKGIRDGAANEKINGALMTFHPKGGTYRPPATSSGEFYHEKDWLDFNMIQSGHRIGNRNFERIYEDYSRSPTKPTIDAEPCYEHHPAMHDYKHGEFFAHHLRRRGYWSVLAGGFGFTYGGSGIYQMSTKTRKGKDSHFKNYWHDALDYVGANDMKHLRALFESRPFVNPARIPDQSLVISPPDPIDIDKHIQAARAEDFSYIIAYFTSGASGKLRLKNAGQRTYKAWWYNPRDGKTYDGFGNESNLPFDEVNSDNVGIFDPPGSTHPDNDWALVLDDVASGYKKPGL